MRNAADMPDFPLKAIVAVNNPFDIWLSINLMRGKIFEKHLANELKRNLVIRQKPTENEKGVYETMIKTFGLDMTRISKVETWRDFDEEFTRKVHPKWPSTAQYYYEASCLQKVKDIKVPTLVLHSKDDPIVPIDCLPIDECEANRNIITAVTDRGGHVCYFMGLNGEQRWYTYACADFLDTTISLLQNKV